MATTTVRDFLRDTRDDIAALTDSGPLLFNRVRILPTADPETVLRNPRLPEAILVDIGGQLDPLNGKLWNRVLEVAIFMQVPRDMAGEKAVDEVLRLGDLLTDALEYLETNSGIYLMSDTDFESVEFEDGTSVVSKSYHYQYSIERA